ncbi:hypothetical protein B9N43_16625 [Denitratisoma sp. DHT3]|uniref:hypothetical protein n=1 Tax=Denitratisoma sp. DHT3 TaxID=1981880 RepID=UPI001198A482|nr:hypothetical protein [Denitratisoma sp. DHT3]QDX82718.1 hypothetical protein B9N43_16625 [Denitratisoma sp. DHT3]
MDQLAEATGKCLVQPLQVPSIIGQLEALFENYVMQSQRDTHRQMTGEAAQAHHEQPMARVELF